MIDPERIKSLVEKVENLLRDETVEDQLACIDEMREMLDRFEEGIDDFLSTPEPDED